MTITKNVWKAAALLLILSLITAVMISGTYARYTSEFAGEDTALVAKWEVDGTGGIFTTSGAGIDLDLFSHAYDEHIKTSAGDVFIAPGVEDNFVIQFNNKSDVDAQVTFQIAETGNADVPIKYGLAPDDITHDIAWVLDKLNDPDTSTFAAIAMETGEATQTVYWEWPFAAGDSAAAAADTALGVGSATGASRITYGLTITASAIQIQPE